MEQLAQYVVVGWCIAVIGVFPSFGTPRRAVLFVVFSGTLFLPEALPSHVALGPIHLTKYHAISYAALLGVLLFDSGRLRAISPHWVDIPAVVWCLCPLPSVLTNAPPPDGSEPLRDALSQTWAQTVTFGIPYLLGRLYFSHPAGIRDLTRAALIAAAVYIPLCWFEIRLSPQLHRMAYGYAQHSFAQTIRFDGYRPMVFLQHGLALAFVMISATLLASWTWLAREKAPALGANDKGHRNHLYLVILLIPTAVFLKSTGALILGLVGFGVLWTGRAMGTRAGLLLLVTVPLVYVSLRATDSWSGESLVAFIAENIEADRAQSLQFRLDNEYLLVKKALEQPIFGWGGWGRNRVYHEMSGDDLSVTDGLWIIVLGDRGIFGLCALGGMLLLPVVHFARTVPADRWSHPNIAPVAAWSVVLVLWVIDSLLNAMILPIYFVIAGGLVVQSELDENTPLS